MELKSFDSVFATVPVSELSEKLPRARASARFKQEVRLRRFSCSSPTTTGKSVPLIFDLGFAGVAHSSELSGFLVPQVHWKDVARSKCTATNTQFCRMGVV
jgi:hypothetical protein